MEKRNFHGSLLVYLFVTVRLVTVTLVAVTVTSCALSAPQTRDEPAKDEPQVAAAGESGPFEVAVDWASALYREKERSETEPSETEASKPVSEGVRQVVDDWKVARVARVWAVGKEYRAIVVQRNTARETPAVLLHIRRGDAGGWKIAGAEPATSTHLWSEL